MTRIMMVSDSHELTKNQSLLLDALKKHVEVDVVLKMSSLENAPTTPLLFSGDIHEAVAKLDARRRSRIVALGVRQASTIEEDLEPLGIGGALDSMTELTWATSSGRGEAKYGANGLFGRVEIANKLGGVIKPMPIPSERYCFFASKAHLGVPHLLADYLGALKPA